MAGIQPYAFEPETETESEEEISEEEAGGRRKMDVSEWCTCGHCCTMETEAENICCREVTVVLNRMQQLESPVHCMTDHPGLHPVCLSIYALQNALNLYQRDFGDIPIRGYGNRCRFLAYRFFVSWCWGYLGRTVRVVIPSCVVQRVRRKFPDGTGQYVGFRPPL
ncbi:P2X purinoceptor 7-like [Engraulis encrasicolus]|uniref:P2X purinoceptor 7-like n=1 Tax=Engraulis encrasicolus TaxID=184585 RepID=UPI002FD4AA4E